MVNRGGGAATPLRHGSLFSGIGGFDLAAEWAGWENAFHCEFQPWCRRVLRFHFPNAISYGDIKKTDFRGWQGRIDVLSGGFPCQPFSSAGKRRGAQDDRYLWPEYLRAIEECQPRWVVGENVAGILTMVQPGDGLRVGRKADLFGAGEEILEARDGFILHGILEDLERRGYAVQTFLIPAAAIGAPHRRDRVWIVGHRGGGPPHNPTTAADSRGQRRGEAGGADRQPGGTTTGILSPAERLGGVPTPPHPKGGGNGGPLRGGPGPGENPRAGNERAPAGGRLPMPGENWTRFPTQPPLCGRDDGIPAGMDPRAFSRWRRESLRAYGNAIVPQVALRIFEAINRAEPPFAGAC